MSGHRWRVGLVGCGTIAWAHLEHLGRLAAKQRLDIVGLCDHSLATARFAADRAGVAAAYATVDELLEQARPEVVHVLTPPHTHEAVSVRCLAAGAHVLCEKPATIDRTALERVLAVSRATGRRFAESQNLRWNDPVLTIGQTVGRGDLGEVHEIDLLLALDLSATSLVAPAPGGPAIRLPGGAVHDLLPHLAYLFLHLAGSDLEQRAAEHPDSIGVVGRLQNLGGHDQLGFDHLDALVAATPVRGRIRVASDLRPNGFRVVVRGSTGAVETDLYHPYRRIESGRAGALRSTLDPVASGARLASSGLVGLSDKVRRHDVFHGLGRLLDAWYTALDHDREPPVTPSMMRATAALTDRLVELRSTP